MTKSLTITNRSNETFIVLVSDDKYAEVSKFKWHIVKGAGGRLYVARSITGQGHYYLHWQIVGKPSRGLVIDHRDGDGLNNTSENLRICTQSQNCQNRGAQSNNTSGYKGVSWSKQTQAWISQGKVNGKLKVFGAFDSPEEAHAAYCMHVQPHHGEYFNNGGTATTPLERVIALYRELGIRLG